MPNIHFHNDVYLKSMLYSPRYDILHACDVAEDFAVAYGFDRLRDDMHLPSTNTIGQEFELNYLSDKMRLLLSQNNYIEVATFSLCSKVRFLIAHCLYFLVN